MCRTGGRRCPSDRSPSEGQRSARNARRRARYADAKAGVFAVPTMEGAQRIRTDRIDDESRFAFLNGQCFALAVGLADRIEGARVGIVVRDGVDDLPWGVDYDDPDDVFLLRYDDGWFANAVHAVVVSPDGDEVLDVDGFRDAVAFREEVEDVHEGSLVVLSADDLRSAMARGEMDPKPHYAAGERMAQTVLEVYSGDGDDREVDSVVFEFLASDRAADVQGLLELPPEQLAGLCEDINGSFALWLGDQGEEPLLVDYVSRPGSAAPDDYAHTVCVVGDDVYDLTYGQIEPGAPVPLVVPRWRWEQQWRPLGERSVEDLED